MQRVNIIFDEPEHRLREEIVKPKDEEFSRAKDEETSEAKDGPAEYAFCFIEYYNEDRRRNYQYSEVKLFSKSLISILKETLEQDIDENGDEVEMDLRQPYKLIMFSWDKLLKRAKVPEEREELDSEKRTRQELVELLECIRTSQELKDYFEPEYGKKNDILEVSLGHLPTFNKSCS